MTRFVVRAATVLWPAFVIAGIAEMLLFALVDPQDLHWIGGESIALSRQAIYTLTFLIMWVLISVASSVTLWLEVSAQPGGETR